MFGAEFGLTCEGCFRQEPTVRYARDVKKHLCHFCWADTAPADPARKAANPPGNQTRTS